MALTLADMVRKQRQQGRQISCLHVKAGRWDGGKIWRLPHLRRHFAFQKISNEIHKPYPLINY